LTLEYKSDISSTISSDFSDSIDEVSDNGTVYTHTPTPQPSPTAPHTPTHNQPFFEPTPPPPIVPSINAPTHHITNETIYNPNIIPLLNDIESTNDTNKIFDSYYTKLRQNHISDITQHIHGQTRDNNKQSFHIHSIYHNYQYSIPILSEKIKLELTNHLCKALSMINKCHTSLSIAITGALRYTLLIPTYFIRINSTQDKHTIAQLK